MDQSILGFQFRRFCRVCRYWIFPLIVCRNGSRGCVRIVETLGIDLKCTWIGVRKSWIEAVKWELTGTKRPGGRPQPLERIVFPGLHVAASQLHLFGFIYLKSGFLLSQFVKTVNRTKPFSIFISQLLISKSRDSANFSRHRSSGKWSTRRGEHFDVSLARWVARFSVDLSARCWVSV